MTTPSIKVHLDRLGRTFTNVPRLKVDSDFLIPTDAFEFDLVAENPKDLRGLEGEPVTIEINGAQQLIGRIDDREVGQNGATNTFFGRDYLADLQEGQLQEASVKKGEAIYDIIQRIGANWGIAEVVGDGEGVDMREVRTGRSKVSGKIPPGLKTAKHSEFKSNEGEGALAYLTRVVTRHGATLQPLDKRTSIGVITPNFDQQPSYLMARTRDGSGTSPHFVGGYMRSSWGSVPTSFTAKGRAGGGNESREPMFHQYDYYATRLNLFAPELLQRITDVFETRRLKPGEVGDPLKLYRPAYMDDNESRSPAQLERSAFRRVATKLKDTLIYNATVSSITDPESGRVWSVNTMLDVYDDVADVTETLWILGRTINVDPKGSGVTTNIRAIRPGTLQL